MECLKQGGWGIEAGIEVFYSLGLQSTSAVDTKAIDSLFNRYKGM